SKLGRAIPMRGWKRTLTHGLRFAFTIMGSSIVDSLRAENTAGIRKREREKSHGQNCKTQGCKVDAEAHNAETRDAQQPSARPNTPRRVGQASRRAQDARGSASPLINRIGAGLRPEAPNGCVRPKRLRSPLCANKNSVAHSFITTCCKTPENAAKMCACS